ncbi:ribosome biogenesis GTP-binding protein YihA/YsxC [Methylocystis sp. MJC1]|jgi:GTP-binding protein|uniref:ribosome biogenesis GTP-binding protein YihA/YsxC n=1 Tax=Methylocystis sp. MJC1 TaxID=2654282 RepID=UPI0013EB189C|nr:ribosome biogenesis GTP-binding protein YihA/YsxC [Methylocystis sp. MJC1]KAF2990326.1 putative GTP-binding protein EngB [Methylocystis sp. MJC1]MBU6528125.1 YihA family ribosome biogenesis GTP-binding protein [Methylocystis sp. MJC1]UZX11037.1 ribosome biogenesis GTP-binding protein YihA/YsxC [Methylocystis sp. MJC1]
MTDFLEDGRLLFAGPCDFIFASAKAGDLPPLGPPEIAFAGRSNVGKSSLLNALTNRKTLARVSHTPGRTQQLNFFALGGQPGAERLRLVDMPGYGYAAVSKEKVASWGALMRDYLRGRASLARVFVLVDGRRGVKPVDEEMFDLLDKSAVSYQVVLTKHDELKVSERAAVVAATTEALSKRPAAYPEIIFTSSQTGEGIPALRGAVAQLLAERGA